VRSWRFRGINPARSAAVQGWLEREPGDAVVAIDRDPRVLQVKTPRGNAYLVLGEQVAVIDPNLPGEADQIARALATEGRSLADVAHVTCTHLHFDHASGLDDLARAAGATLLLSREARPYVEGGVPYPFPGLRFSWPFLDVWFRIGLPGGSWSQFRAGRHIGYPGSSYRLRTPVTRWMVDGEEVPELGGLVALHSPGHCPDHTCFLHPASGALLAGDMYITVRGAAECNRIVLDRPAQAASDRRLRELGVQTVWPGHGPAMSLPARP